MTETTEETYRERLKERLLVTADAIVAREGVDRLQARRVAEGADCSIGTLYNIFGDIDGLLLEVNARTLQDLGRVLSVAARRSADSDLETRLNTLAIAYLDFATVNQRRWRAIFEHRMPETKIVPEIYFEDRRQLLALIESQLSAALPDPMQLSDASHTLFAAVHGIVLLSLDAKLGPFEPAKCERHIRFLVGRVVTGLDAKRV